ncbi:MAG: 50S ribosomal protein L11 methyltransferase [Gammaproteobacteria bacterium]|nr:50S ribosomal protein L11 methyltransferase [Gammaproteobacteria bacterium]
MWRRLVFSIDSDQESELSDCLEQHGAISISLEPDADTQVLLEPGPGEQPLWGRLRVGALYDPATSVDLVLDAVRTRLGASVAMSCEVTRLDDRDWEAAWREDVEPLCFGSRLWVLPTRMPLPAGADAADQAILRLDPGLAFGSGRHPTTQLCLGFLAERPIRGLRVMDFGCGSGILAIAAALLGAVKVLATDHDPQALIACRQNAVLNDCESDVQLFASDPSTLHGHAPVDLLVANILANPLIELAPAFAGLLEPGGEIALSGILEDQASMVASAYAPWFEVRLGGAREGWCRLDGVRKSDAVA